jgi:very-short-patch-repair endonuclease
VGDDSSLVLADLIANQDGMIARRQVLDIGLSRSQAWQQVRAGRWQAPYPGVYATFTGPVGERARVWAAVLAAGQGAAASHRSALWLAGFASDPPEIVQVSVPAERRVMSYAGVRIHHRRGMAGLVQMASCPPRTRFEPSLLDVADLAESPGAVLTLGFAAIQRRFTTARRLREELDARPRHRWRALLAEVLSESEAGVASVLERRYLRDVERAHRLPVGVRNSREEVVVAGARRSRYLDVRYEEWRTVVELDGRHSHPAAEAFRDWRRDNDLVAAGDVVLRYGWHDVVASPCRIADQVAVVLGRSGWAGQLRRCRECGR